MIPQQRTSPAPICLECKKPAILPKYNTILKIHIVKTDFVIPSVMSTWPSPTCPSTLPLLYASVSQYSKQFFLEKCTDKLCPTMLRKELTIRRALSFDTINYSAASNQLRDDFGCGYKTSWMPETCIRSNQQLDS